MNKELSHTNRNLSKYLIIGLWIVLILWIAFTSKVIFDFQSANIDKKTDQYYQLSETDKQILQADNQKN